MATIATKRKLDTKSIKERYAALKEVEEGLSKSQAAMKYDIPKNTLSTWIKSKEKMFESMKTQVSDASDGWRDCWKNRYNVSFKTVSGEGNFCTAEWKQLSLQFYPSTNLMKFITQI